MHNAKDMQLPLLVSARCCAGVVPKSKNMYIYITISLVLVSTFIHGLCATELQNYLTAPIVGNHVANLMDHPTILPNLMVSQQHLTISMVPLRFMKHNQCVRLCVHGMILVGKHVTLWGPMIFNFSTWCLKRFCTSLLLLQFVSDELLEHPFPRVSTLKTNLKEVMSTSVLFFWVELKLSCEQ